MVEKQKEEKLSSLRIDSNEWDFNLTLKDGKVYVGVMNRETGLGFYRELLTIQLNYEMMKLVIEEANAKKAN